MSKKTVKIQSFIALIPFVGFLIVLFWAMGICYKVAKSFFAVLKLYVFLLIPFVVFSVIYVVMVSFFAIPLIQNGNIPLGITLILVLGYILFIILGIIVISVEKLIVKKYDSQNITTNID